MGRQQRRDYSYFQHGIFGVPGRGRTGMVSMSLANNLEMKVKSDKDTTGVKKISLIENLTLSQSYNFAADSLNWSNLSTGLLLRLVKNFNLNLNATWDPYTYKLSPSGSPVRVNIPRWKAGKGWVRLASAGTSFSYTFNNDTFRRKKDSSSTKNNSSTSSDTDDEDDYEGESFAQRASARRNEGHGSDISTDVDGYEKWECPWSLSVNYSVNYGQGEFDFNKMEFKGKFNQNLSFNGNIRPTKNWNFSFSASYNFDLHKIAYMNCSISRDLHDFTMTCSIVPVGPYKSYNFHIAMKSSLLQDLKYDKRSSNKNGVDWY